jgi:ketosteroid isomerase-like protein
MTPSERNELLIERYLKALEAFDTKTMAACLSPRVVQTEWPNALKPHGDRRGLEKLKADFERGKALLKSQTYEVRHLTATDKTCAIQVHWKGVLAIALGPLKAWDLMEAHSAMFFTFDAQGLILTQDNYDCFEPFG